jgi:hypothetical protein
MVVWNPHGRIVHDPELEFPFCIAPYLQALGDGIRLIGTITRFTDGDGTPEPPKAA